MAIYLLVDGKRIAPETSERDLVMFRLDMPAREVRLISGHASPLELAGTDDPRRLGVAVRQLHWRQADDVREVPIDSPGLIDGFHQLEHYNDKHGPFRWTNGNAAVPPSLYPPWRGDTRLQVRLITWEGSTIEAAPKPEAALLSAFENLGEKCDLAFAQQHHGLELPLTLLRWAGTSYEKLLRGLTTQFDGLGDPATTEVVWDDCDYRLRTPYLNFHTGVSKRRDAAGVADILMFGSSTLRLLRRKLLKDITDARRIFVFRTTRLDFGTAEMRRLHDALHAIGPAALLCVTSRQPYQSGTGVERLAEGLYAGRLESAASSHDGWLALCSRTLALHYAG